MSYAAEIDPAVAVQNGVKTYVRKVGNTGVVAVSGYMLGNEGNTYAITSDVTECGSSHWYEFITLNGEDATRLESNGVQGWDAAVPKSINPKSSKASTNRAYPQPNFPTPPPSSAPAFTHTYRSRPCSISLAPYTVYGTQHEPFVRAAREAQRPCQAHYAFVPRLHVWSFIAASLAEPVEPAEPAGTHGL